MDKVARIKRRVKTRKKIQRLAVNALQVNRTLQHIYAQIVDPSGKVLAAASTQDKELRSTLKSGGNKTAATAVGQLIAKRAKKAGVEQVAFDRSGFKFHGRVKALADAAREQGIQF